MSYTLKEIELVLNKSYGGFHLTEEMANWLAENKKWKIGDANDFNSKEKDIYKLSNNFYICCDNGQEYPNDSIEFRSNKDLIECIKTLQALHKDLNSIEKGKSQLFSLKVMKYTISLDIENIYDGIETLTIEQKELES